MWGKRRHICKFDPFKGLRDDQIIEGINCTNGIAIASLGDHEAYRCMRSRCYAGWNNDCQSVSSSYSFGRSGRNCTSSK